MKIKVHCQKCGLYLGRTAEEDFTVQIVCPLCEEMLAAVRNLLTGEACIPEPTSETHLFWSGDVGQIQFENTEARCLLRLIMERREAEIYEFKPLWTTNGSGR